MLSKQNIISKIIREVNRMIQFHIRTTRLCAKTIGKAKALKIMPVVKKAIISIRRSMSPLRPLERFLTQSIGRAESR